MKIKIIVILVIIILVLMGVYYYNNSFFKKETSREDSKEELINLEDEKNIRELVETFASKMAGVYLNSPQEEIKEEIRENYGGLITEDLSREWFNNPYAALGRETSSPWPASLEIIKMERISDKEYEIAGDLILATSLGEAGREKIFLKIIKEEDKWLIGELKK